MTHQQKDWTPLPAKWTPSSILKLHEQLWSNYLKQFLSSDEYPNIINYKIDKMLKWFQLIHNYAMSGQMSYKK